MLPQTPARIIFIIVCTLATLVVIYISVLAYCVISGPVIQQDVMREFSTAGMFILGVFCGLLSKTSSAPTPGEQTQTTVTKTVIEPDPKPE